jgi:hypothetical protein
MTDYRQIYESLIKDPRYLNNLAWGESRPGHPEGAIGALIAEIEANLEVLRHKLSEEDYLAFLANFA